MDTTVMTIRIDTRLKRSAQQVAKDLGFTVSALIHGYLTQLVKTKAVSFSAEEGEEPNEYLKELIREAEDERKAGKQYSFDNADEAIAFLEQVTKEKKHRAD